MSNRLSRLVTSGVEVVVKRAIDAEQRGRLQHEAETLRSLRHPGVIQFVDLVEQPDHLELHTGAAGSVTLADHRPTSLGAVAGIAAGVAGVLADLHGAGVTHGHIAADHVIIGPARHPVLCSFASSGPADAEATADDLAGLADLLESLADRAETAPGRLGRRQQRSLALAVAACRDPGASARAIAGMLASTPGAVAASLEPDPHSSSTEANEGHGSAEPIDAVRRPQRPDDPWPGTRTWRDRVPPPPATLGRRSLLVAVGIVLGAAALTALSLRPTAERTARAAPGAPAPAARTASPAVAPGAAPEPTTTPHHPCPEGSFDIDRDGCDDAISVHGNLILANDTWFEAGRPGDVVEIGDWDCDGIATPAVLRPTTGDVFVFDAWGTEPTTALAVDRTPGAIGLTTSVEGGCARLHTIDRDGHRSPLPVAVR